MTVGYFDDTRREYVITTPNTYPWINYLGTEDFFSLISNTAGGYSFYQDARLRHYLPLQQRTAGQRRLLLHSRWGRLLDPKL